MWALLKHTQTIINIVFYVNKLKFSICYSVQCFIILLFLSLLLVKIVERCDLQGNYNKLMSVLLLSNL